MNELFLYTLANYISGNHPSSRLQSLPAPTTNTLLALGPLVRTSRSGPRSVIPMTYTLEISDDLGERLESHCEEGQTVEEFVEELVNIYETEGSFLQEGYTE